ncbi:BTAD domain-containing putative transcriptional regulator [Cryptosporangium aurantiacum]|uniref:DNA-binding transcriptional activator of the SARP family n=1 Tax=Cryptosporangium aurantiacum TaxID=134849 RepID=A0A1M7RD04_9ACTN|nr:BTAD domain-containing putative transcriptional regulator [Cryptosporangium aurantiacum]SHN44029.1 DNA-binding transcriptional activator of the SARP family [Cryptosporangium aurantiacum]
MVVSDHGPITVCVLGPIRAARGDVPIDLGGPRQRSVIARLAVARRHVVSTDRLIDDLWEGEPPPKALATLQVHVSHLRRALEPERQRRSAATILVSAAPGYALALDDDAVDAWAFEELVGQARSAENPTVRRDLLTQALARWAGPAYAEVADASWAAPEIIRLDGLRLVAFESKADADLELGQAGALVPDLERHFHDHPTREDAVRLLSLALYRSGRQADALAVLRRARAHLADELGLDPGPELRELEAAMLAQAPSLSLPTPPVRVTRAAPPPTASIAEDHRSPELRRVLGAIEGRTTAGVVWVGGEAGAGKTTLAEAVTEHLRTRGWQSAWGRCPEVDGAPPAWAWSEVVRVLPVRDDPALAALRADQPTEGGPGDAFWLARAVAAQVADAAAHAPVLIVLDDVHRADGLTLQLLRRLVDEVAQLPVVVLATYRSSEADEQLAATRAALAVTTTHHEALTGLDDAGIGRLARSSGLPLVDAEVIALLRERTGGNPLFVRELARLMAAEGLASARGSVPTGVGDVLRRRIARLPGPSVTVLRQAAVLGREVDVDLLAEVAGRDPDEVIDALETAVLAGLLDEPAPGRVRFAHALVRDTLYADTPVLRRTRLHAAALATLSEQHADAATLAHHAVASAGTANARSAIGYVIAAARAAAALGASAEAAAHWATAVRLHDLAGAPADESLVELLLPSISAHARAGDTDTAREQQVAAVRIATRLGNSELLAAALSAWDAPLVWRVRDQSRQNPELLRPLLALLDPASGTSLLPSVRTTLLIALFREVEGEDDDLALQASAEALGLARASDDPRRLCEALNARAYAALGPDLIDERDNLAAELHAVAERAGLVEYQAVAHWLLFLAAAARTDLKLAKGHVDQAVALSSTGQFAHLLGVFGIFSAALLVLAGRLDEGRERYEAVAARLAEAGLTNGAMMAMIGRFTVGFARGDLSSAVADAEWLHRAMPGILTEVVVLCLLDAGREPDARAAWQLRSPANSRDHYWLVVTALRAHAAARLGDVAEAVAARDALLPYAGRIAGLDSGSMPVGPVDDALAAVAELEGDVSRAARHRADAAAVRERVATELRALET